MAFRPIVKQNVNYPSPEALFNDCKKRKYPGVLAHQADVLRSYQDDAIDRPDVAFQMPTGSGKTLVAVLLAEWRRRTRHERPLYLTPTKQLAYQVAAEAKEKYDIRVIPLVGSKHSFSPQQQADWEAGEAIVVTTFSGLFNTKPAFQDPDLIIVDDAHAAENYFAAYWSILIKKVDFPSLWAAVVSLLSSHLRPFDIRRMSEKATSPEDIAWADKLPTPALFEIENKLSSLFDEHLERGSDAWFSWQILKSKLLACQLYVSCSEFLIRPLLPPSSTHAPFSSAKQRIYMSATLGQGGDLERLTGRKAIHRIPIPKTWEVQGLGRRLFLFPSRALTEAQEMELLPKLISKTPRCTVLTPSDTRAEAVAKLIREKCGYSIFTSKQIEESKKPFVNSARAAAVLANRYDGIDFPDDECRLLIIDGMARAANLQERFIMSRMGALILLNDRMMTRVVQAFGRCTRSATDYSCVVVLGHEVLNMLLKRPRRSLLHPELQAEIEFGLEQSTTTNQNEFVEFLEIFLNQDRTTEWQDDGETAIQGLRSEAKQLPVEGALALAASVSAEIDFQERLWNSDFEGALQAARRAISQLNGEGLGGYRGLWNYLAGSSAYLATQLDGRKLEPISKDFFWKAARETTGISWLKALSQYAPTQDKKVQDILDDSALIERLETTIDDIGIASESKLVRIEKDIREGLNQNSKGPFERAHVLLGQLLGFDSGNKETPGAPDPWWIVDAKLCFIFEDHSDSKAGLLSVEKARQVSSHPNWVKANLSLDADARIIPVLISPVKGADTDALPHLDGVSFWDLDDFRSWAEQALLAFANIRNVYPGTPGDLAWRAEARAALARSGVDLKSLLDHLGRSDARQVLNPKS